MILRQFKLLGIVFLALLVGGVWLTYGIFTKKFVDYDEVTMQSSRIGLQLPERADVKIRGVIVGEVLGYEPTEEGADITLGLYPEEIDTIPAGVTGSIVPKTLFGEKYVALVIDDEQSGQGGQDGAVPAGTGSGGGESIEAGDVIERTEVATEVERVLSDLNPLLRTVQPAELNMTLNALATALEGRGDQLGENIETLDDYLKRLNPLLPAAIEDLRLTAEVSDIYADVLPEVGQILRDQVTTLGTLEEQSETLNALFRDVSAFSGSARTFLAQNEENLVRLGQVTEPQVRLLAKYSPQFGCLTRGVVNAGKLQAEAFRNFTLHIVLETLPNQPRPYDVNDAPRYGEDRGPNCLNLPTPPGSQENPNQVQPNFDDGVDEPTGKGTSRVAPGFSSESAAGWTGSAAESELLKSLLAPGMGVSGEQVPDLGTLLLAPMARGAEVSLR